MNPRWAPVILLLSLTLVTAGCQQQTVRGEPGGAATGNLGSPLVGPSPADVYIDLSGAYLREDQLTEAFMNAKKAVIVDPGSSNAHYMMALVQQRLGQVKEADAAYLEAIRRDPRNPVALNAYGSFLCDQQRFDDADPYFRRALNNPLYSTPWLASHNAASCALRAGNEEQAERDFRAALRANPRFSPSLLGMAKITFEQQNYFSTRAYLQRLAEVAPHTAESLWIGVQTEQRLGDKDQMASYGLLLRANFPDSEEANYLQTFE